MENITSQSAAATQAESLTPLVGDLETTLVRIAFMVAFDGAVGFLGCVANIINIIVFLKQGFGETVNISLMSLAVSDLGSLLTLVWESITLNPYFIIAPLPFNSEDVRYLTAAVPHAIFVRIAWWITAFVTFERCLCIVIPLKVKQVITARRTLVINLTIFVVNFLCLCPIFICRSLQPVEKQIDNSTKTLVETVYCTDDHFPIEKIGFTFNVVSQFSAFIIDLVCTIAIIQILSMKSKWRSETANTSASGSKAGFASRDKKIIKMIGLISGIFIICSMPSCVNYAVTVTFWEYTQKERYQNIDKLMWALIVALEAINSSVTILVYYNMSSKYKMVFKQMFSKKEQVSREKH
ncbi:cysteinyl leukotriene receptor 2 [Biomphalaria glabrata]|nr:cysteinyl leukotriene receptor 2 [Biomphalaria glabrata]